VAYWLTTRFDASATVVAGTFAALGVLQAGSFLAAPRVADRIGLLPAMVVTHLTSNLLLAAVAFATSLPAAIGLLLARTCLSQMDVPTRQAYVMALVDPAERTAAAAYTGTVRYLTRPAGPPIAGLAQSVWLGLPFLLSGALKAGYDLTLWAWFRHVPFPDTDPEPAQEPS
jgi:MFS family permease